MTSRPINFYANVKRKVNNETTKVFDPTPEYGAGGSNKELSKFEIRIREVREYDGTIYSKTAKTLDEALNELSEGDSATTYFSTKYRNSETVSQEVVK